MSIYLTLKANGLIFITNTNLPQDLPSVPEVATTLCFINDKPLATDALIDFDLEAVENGRLKTYSRGLISSIRIYLFNGLNIN